MITDEMLRSSAARSSELFVHTITSDYVPTQQYTPSDLFGKKIKKLFRQAKHPYFYKAMRRTASIFLAAVLAGSMYLAVDTEARAAFLSWIKDVYEHSIVYRVMPKSTAKALPQCELTWLPDGYDEPDIYKDDTMYTALYKNQVTGNDLIIFYCLLDDETQTEFFTTQQPEYLLVSGTVAEFYGPSDDSTSSSLLWIDNNFGVLCTINGIASKETLVRIAENLYLIDPTK